MVKNIAIIGLDGMPWNILRTIFDKGMMPFLKHITRKKSLTATLKSTLPPSTLPAWTSIATGVNPGKHGVYSFFSVSKGSLGFESKIVTAYDVKYPRIHELVGMFKVKSLIINLPATYPPEYNTAFKTSVVVSDWLSPEIRAYPTKYEELAKSLKIHLVSKATAKPPKIYRLMKERVEKISSATLNVLDTFKPNLMFIVFSEPDWIMHRDPLFLKGDHMHLSSKMFNIIDNFIKEVHSIFDHTVLVSDHGFSLYEKGISTISFLKGKGIKASSIGASKPKSRRKITEVLFKIGRYKRIRPLARAIAKKLFKEKYSERITPYSEVEVLFPGSEYPGYAYVKPGMENNVIDTLKELNLLKVYRSYEVYNGPYVTHAPDILIEPVDYSYLLLAEEKEEVITEIKKEASNHHPHGIFIATDFECNGCKMLQTYDVVPIVLHLMGLPIPSDTDSKLLWLEKKPKEYHYSMKWKLLRSLEKRI